LVDPIVRISDYRTDFVAAVEPSPELHTPALYLPPEDFFNKPVTQAADIWTLGVNLYEVLGEISTLGRPPSRWWGKWENRKGFFASDGSWLRKIRICTPGSRPLSQQMWDMGRGETPETCQWAVEGGEMRALEDLLRGMLKFEPAERLSAEELMTSEYMVKWAMPAWERQLQRS
ncbi:hypothetical protein B0H63DRAFT_384865, partial [Podospora didyma]